MSEELLNTAQTNEGEQATEATVDAAESTAEQTEPTEATEATEQETAEQDGPPEKYELNPGEGKKFDSEFLNVYEDTARELGLSNEKAQKLIDKVGPVLEQRQLARIEAVRTEWADQSKVDKEFGGDKLEENLSVAKKGLEEISTPELRQLINDTGLGNNPEVIRLFYRVGKMVTQDKFVGGKPAESKQGPKSFNDLADALYT